MLAQDDNVRVNDEVHGARVISLLLSLLLLCSLSLDAGAQTVETRFERDINRYRFTSRIAYDGAFGGWQTVGEHRFFSDAFEITGGRLTFRDEQLLLLRSTRPLSARLAAGAQSRTLYFSQSQVLGHETTGFLRFTPDARREAEVRFGLALDHRPGVPLADGTPVHRRDAGPAVGASVGWLPPVEGYDVEVRARGGWTALSPRQSRDLGVAVGVERRFEETRLTLNVEATSMRRDAYQAASFLNRTDPAARPSETVEATTSDTLRATLDLDTPLFSGLRFNARLDAGTNGRRIRTLRAPSDVLFFDTDFTRRALSFETTLHYARPSIEARVFARAGAQEQQRLLANRDQLPPVQAAQKSELLQQADFDRGDLTLGARARLTRGRVGLLLEGNSSILRHDTPERNSDDRDDVLHTLLTGVNVSVSRYVDFETTVYGSYFHTVYLKRERSGENNRQRSLRLRPALVWQPAEGTRARFASEVRATYTVDDFTLPGRQRNDQSARELRYELSFEHRLPAGARFVVDGSFSELHLGRLLWDRFAEIPFDTVRTTVFHLRLQAGQRIHAEVGARLFLRSDFDRAVTVRYPRTDSEGRAVLGDDGSPLTTTISRPGRELRRQLGPTCAIFWETSRGSLIRLDGWFNVQRVHQRLYGTLPEATADEIRTAARRGSRQLFPNVALSVRWRI